MLIGLTGTNSAGKGEVAAYLVKKGFVYYSLSDEIREIMAKEGIPATRENMIKKGVRLRKEKGLGCLAELVLKKAGSKAVVDSVRNPGEANALRKRKGFFLIAVDAPIELRFQRAKERGRIGDGETLADFRQKQEQEMKGKGSEQNLSECMKMADFTIINDSTKEKLYKKIETVLTYAAKR
ncbi:MAG: AAA family ATPase [Candidatus Woesearchaeota archaeon]